MKIINLALSDTGLTSEILTKESIQINLYNNNTYLGAYYTVFKFISNLWTGYRYYKLNKLKTEKLKIVYVLIVI